MSEYKKEFEQIDKITDRIKVPNGWLVRTIDSFTEGISVHQIFIEDKYDRWYFEKGKETTND